MSRKYLIETFGCQMNVHDSERMAGLMEQAGYVPAGSEADADVIVINTCSVREHAEEKLYTRLGQIRVREQETGRPTQVVVAGCVAQQEGEALFKKSNGRVIDVVLGTQQQKLLPMLIDQAGHVGRPTIEIGPLDDVSFPLGVVRREDPVRALVNIIEGCNDYCAFCVVPYTRGHERMRSKAEIVADVHDAVASGRPEVQLLGQIVNHYQAPDDPSCDFPDLLAAVHDVPGLSRIRFASPHPRHTGARLIDAIRSLPKVCKHIHLPVQSGSTRVLQAMRRRHTRDDYLALLDRIREGIPGVTISTDMIVGFPGETVADFEDTLSLVERAQYVSMFSFKYSPRPNTLAAKRMPDDVTDAEKTSRIVALQALQRSIQSALHERMVGSRVEILVDSLGRRHPGEFAGRTGGNVVVNVQPVVPAGPPVLGALVDVVIERGGPHSLAGRLVTEPGGATC